MLPTQCSISHPIQLSAWIFPGWKSNDLSHMVDGMSFLRLTDSAYRWVVWKLLLVWIATMDPLTAMYKSAAKQTLWGISLSVPYDSSPTTLQNCSAIRQSVWWAQWKLRVCTKEVVSSLSLTPRDLCTCLWQVHESTTGTYDYVAFFQTLTVVCILKSEWTRQLA